MSLMNRLACAVLLMAGTALGCVPPAGVPKADKAPTLDVTHWTDTTELFMEYPPLVAGQAALFAVHLTTLVDFQAVTAGRASIEFVPDGGGQATTFMGPEPSRPGVFRVEGVPPTPGPYRFSLTLEMPGLSDRHDLGTVTVFADDAAARVAAESGGMETAEAIAYLKEPQWTNGFATALVEEAGLRTSIRAPAMIHPLPGGEAIVAAPAAGRLAADFLLSIGDRVRPGQVLARLEPRLSEGADRATLAAEVAETLAALDAARAEQTRAERLLAERAVPARRVEDAGRAVRVAEARLGAAEARLAQRDETLRIGGGAASGNAFVLQAPIGGRLAEVMVTLGASYDEGAPLFRIVRTDRVEVEVQVPAANAVVARETVGLRLEFPGQPMSPELEPDHVHDSGVLDPTTRALALQMEIENPGEQLLIGQVGTALLYTRTRQQWPVVPRTAVLTESGRPYVFVQLGGERFVRRFIEIAATEGDLVAVQRGVMLGERVVAQGAYEVQLASAATGLPAEGHVH
ncbi:MAG: efflux RND transporter periplasmic adaptor subunit [Vicinamibacterales bacterium]|nr:efflux RND transporter periplasmic adaptor subunit [Vicinamibacterales bacterium]